MSNQKSDFSSTISSSSLLALRADLAARKAGGGAGGSKPSAKPKASSSVGGTTSFLRANRGTAARAKKDETRHRVEFAARLGYSDVHREAMERKAEIYEKLRRGETEGVSDKLQEGALVDFDRRRYEEMSSDEETEDEEYLNEIVEWQDEYGRHRRGPRREQPLKYREPAPPRYKYMDPDELPGQSTYTYRGEQTYFHVFRQSVDARKAQDSDEVHYDASKNAARHHGAVHYNFSRDATERARQMEELKTARAATDAEREARERYARPSTRERRRADVVGYRAKVEERRRERWGDAVPPENEVEVREAMAEGFLEDILGKAPDMQVS